MSFSEIAGIGILIIIVIACFHMIKESFMKPIRYIAKKSPSIDNWVVKALAAKEAYDMFKAATHKDTTPDAATNDEGLVRR